MRTTTWASPFNPRELLARIHAVLRRRPPQEAPGAPSGDNEVVTFGPFTFDLGTRALQKNGEELPLTTGEFAMLKALVRHPRQPLSREKLALLARGREFEPFDRSLDVQVSRLRKLVEVDAAAPATSRPSGAWATCSCRMERADPRPTTPARGHRAAPCAAPVPAASTACSGPALLLT